MKQILLILLLIIQVPIMAQTRGGTNDRKAEKYYEQAKEHARWRRMEMAELSLLEAVKRDERYLDAMNLLVDIYMMQNKIDETKTWTEKILSINPDYSPNLMLILATIEQRESEYETALSWYEKYMKIAPRESSNYQQAKLGAASCEFAIYAMANPVSFEIENMGAAVNSEHDEYFPAMTADEQLLMFTRAIPVDGKTYFQFDKNEDFYFCEKDEDGNWEAAFNPGAPINSVYNEGAPTLSPDGKYLIFTACDLGDMGDYGKDKRGFGSCDLFISVKDGNSWSKPINMGRTINSKHWESQPSFSSDGKTIYFLKGKYDRYHERHDDIYVTELINGRWSQAKPLPPNINTPGSEESVFIHPDNQTLYFSSDGHIGLGGMDIFMSRRQADGSWGDPVNLGYPINTSGHENSFHVSASGEYAIIASNREGGFGKLDLYQMTLPEEVKPNRISYLKGTIKEAGTGKPVEAYFQLIDLNKGDTVVQTVADKKTGSFLVVLPASENYALMAEADGYLFHSENFQLEARDEHQYYEKSIALQPMTQGSSVVLKNVFFDTDKFELKPKSKTELDKLVRLLKDNPALKIEIGGHTDNVGSTENNKVLSENRAKAVHDFLVRAGIAADRLSYKGYGESQPIASNDTAEGRQQNRRTEFVIVE